MLYPFTIMKHHQIPDQKAKLPVTLSSNTVMAMWRDFHENFVLQWVVSFIRELLEESFALECLFSKHAIV